MTSIIAALGICNLFIFFKNWKKLFYLLILFIPYLGYIQHQVQPYTDLAPLIHDYVFIITLYLIIIFTQKNLNILPKDLGYLVFLFIILLLIQMLNPFNSLHFFARIVGLKVWLFYFFFIVIGYKLIDDKKDLKRFCNIFAISAIIPCLIGSSLYIFSQIGNYQEVMTSFYNNSNMAQAATQNFTQFRYGLVKIMRIPSTFASLAQYLNFLIVALIPVLTSIALSNTRKEKTFYQFILFLLIVSALLSGARGAIVYLIIFYVFFYFQKDNIDRSKSGLIKLLILFVVSIVIYKNSILFKGIFDLGTEYTLNYFFVDFKENILKYFFGIGLGNATSGIRYFVESERLNLHEGYYWKVIVELGFFGLILIVLLFFNYLKHAKLTKIKLFKYKEKIFCSSFYAYTCYQMISHFKTWVNFDGYPANFIFFLILGIVLKLGSKEYIAKSYS